MYSIVLAAHSWLRWAAILAGLIAVITLLMNRPMAGPAARATDRTVGACCS
jgi:hypothetical protein